MGRAPPSEVSFLKKRVTASISAYEKFKQNQLKRLDVVKQHIKVDDPIKQAKGTDKYE